MEALLSERSAGSRSWVIRVSHTSVELGLVEGIDQGPAGNVVTDCVGVCVCLMNGVAMVLISEAQAR